MIDLAKVADLVLLLTDASFGFEMEIFEFLNICQASPLYFSQPAGCLNSCYNCYITFVFTGSRISASHGRSYPLRHVQKQQAA